KKLVEMLIKEPVGSVYVIGTHPADTKLILNSLLARLRKRPAGSCRAYLDDLGRDTHLAKYRQQFLGSGDGCQFFAVYQAEERGRLIRGRHGQDVDYYATPARILKLVDERVEFALGVGSKAGGNGAPGVGLRPTGAHVLRLARGHHFVVLAGGRAGSADGPGCPCFGQCYPRGIPRPRWAMMFFWISVVPPPTARPVCHRYWRSKRPFSGTHLLFGSSWP